MTDFFFTSELTDVEDALIALDLSADAETFARRLAALVELASSRFCLPVEVVGGELIVRSELGPFKLTVTRQ